MKRLVAVFLVATLVCVATTAGAGGQVVDNGKVVADPATDYRRYSKEIANSEKAARAKQDQAVSAAQQSVGADEAAFQASLAAEAQSLNAGATQTQADGSAASTPAATEEPQHGLSSGVLIAIAAAALGGLVLIVIVLSALKDKKSRRRRRTKEESVRLADFARKPDPEDK